MKTLMQSLDKCNTFDIVLNYENKTNDNSTRRRNRTITKVTAKGHQASQRNQCNRMACIRRSETSKLDRMACVRKGETSKLDREVKSFIGGLAGNFSTRQTIAQRT